MHFFLVSTYYFQIFVDSAEEAELYMEKVLICDEPVHEVLWRDGFDAVIVDVGATGLPVSDIAGKILADSSGAELHKICMSNPYKNGILMTPKGKPGCYLKKNMEKNRDFLTFQISSTLRLTRRIQRISVCE